MYGARREKTMANPWSLNNSDGITGPRGSRRLRRAAAAFMTEEFQAREPVTEDNIFYLHSSTAVQRFNFDTLNRSNAPVIGVPYEGIEGYSNLEDLFHPEVNEIALESALRKAEDDGITVRALLVSKHQLHFISDEIYAKSVFLNTEIATPISILSALALDLRDIIGPILLHVLYGASKDYCVNGLRLGLSSTKNEACLMVAMLEYKAWMDNFMCKKTSLMVENYRIATSFFREHGIRFCECKVFCQHVEGLIVHICRKECRLVHLDRPSPSTARQAYRTAVRLQAAEDYVARLAYMNENYRHLCGEWGYDCAW
ncbi:hypothetical protein M747DRAFT_349072 [Aspergillus niger ATCC 13496]|uniref:Aminotransferase class I/classII large domain-containing protein n=1 Tax=Aspergillus niger ATCC 13496 TaxID=1353008 RepID=A0A370C260_ASPNG|nr:hypothetical protein M747DRAFT_349072 [Aspergillus niger ATCC 13496]